MTKEKSDPVNIDQQLTRLRNLTDHEQQVQEASKAVDLWTDHKDTAEQDLADALRALTDKHKWKAVHVYTDVGIDRSTYYRAVAKGTPRRQHTTPNVTLASAKIAADTLETLSRGVAEARSIRDDAMVALFKADLRNNKVGKLTETPQKPTGLTSARITQLKKEARKQLEAADA